ncbi:hypothetical protein CALCODRAFT_485833 [Calocera cornea HHB12733]|uniref:Zn(2)-C6 fungal-type domain-containing protein n=1 Tax=Calocera cornea HHB12733 TaxID=1353952 RepID=A0A165E483_9BASI|nr:hypothetical protein CALCODRAFT_485833 [Calocera cornea HHB12733]
MVGTQQPPAFTVRPQPQAPGQLSDKRKRKEAPREKTGCWSCRIRGKKCLGRDPANRNVCTICNKLGIDCLGWGPKIPDELDKKYWKSKWTTDLDARGKIKGRARNIPNNRTRGPGGMHPPHDGSMDDLDMPDGMDDDMNELGENVGDGITNSVNLLPPPSWNIPAGPDGALNGHLSTGFSGLSLTGIGGITPFGVQNPTAGPSMSTSPESSSSNGIVSGLHLNTVDLSQGLDPFTASTASSTDASAMLFSAEDMPASASNFDIAALAGAATTQWEATEDDPIPEIFTERTGSNIRTANTIMSPLAPPVMDDAYEWMWFQQYQNDTRPMQYLVHDTTSTHMLQNVMDHLAASFSPAVMAYLAAVRQKQLFPAWELGDAIKFRNKVLNKLRDDTGPKDEKKAMTALHMVSVSLFDGCRPAWQPFLDYARDWLEQLHSKQDVRAALSAADPLTSFASKTTMWMDIFGAISQQTAPRLLSMYRVLFAPTSTGMAWIDAFANPRVVDMDSTMGAENNVMLAFAETAALDAWKAWQKSKQSLSIPDLVKRGERIMTILRQPYGGTSPRAFIGPLPTQSPQQLMSSVFRSSAKIYLHTVISGFNPAVPEIQEAIGETVTSLATLQSTDEKPYDRSLVLPLFIAGVMTDDLGQRTFIVNRFANIKDVAVGNCGQILELIQAVWERRQISPGVEVSWREVMQEKGMKLLFV